MIRDPARGGLAEWLALAGVAVSLSVSANLLTWIGIPYAEDGGALPVKIHPATYLIGLACLAALPAPGSRPHAVRRVLCRSPEIALYLAGMAFCVLYAAIMTGSGFLIVFVETFIPAGLLALVLQERPGGRAALRRLLQVCLSFNAALAILEAAVHGRLIPLYLDGAAYTASAEDFRPTALYDHPLTGSMLTMLGLMIPPGRRAPRLRIAYVLTLAAGLIAFGGRTAAALAIAACVLPAGATAWRELVVERRIRADFAAAVIAMVLLAPGLAWLGLSTGFGERLAGHLYWDASAQVRVRQWAVLDLLDTGQLLFGCRREDLLALLDTLRLSSGVEVIENFWLLMFIALGVACFPVFAAALGALLAWGARRCGPRGPVLVTTLMLAASSSNSLGRKSNVLLILVASLLAARDAPAGAAPIPGRGHRLAGARA